LQQVPWLRGFSNRRDKTFESLSPWLIRTMAVLRFIAVTIIAVLLLSPLLKTNLREVEKPIIVLAQDNSESIVTEKTLLFTATNTLRISISW
jgi:hypothetical protein